ncbi:MAG: hypothetical protein WC872_00020 [Candidatus Absconditabacterales bacterium]
MYQLMLLNDANLSQRNVYFDSVKATFSNIKDNVYDVILEINSHKFLISIENLFDEIQKFEIIAVKGFIEITNKFVSMLKVLVQHLIYRLE